MFSRNGARVYLAALNKEQTLNVFNPVESMLQSSKELLAEVEISKKQKTILKIDTAGAIITLSKGAEAKQGIKPTLAIVDEYYLYNNDDLISVLKYGFRSVTNPLMIIITTNGKDKSTPYYQEYDRCSKILDGIIQDDSTFAIFYEYDVSDKWDDKSKLIKSNPMIGYTLDYDRDFKADIEEARNKPFKQADYKMLSCNLWVDSIVNGWIPDSKFQYCIKNLPEDDYLKTLPSVLSFDLSKVNDFTVLTQTFYDDSKLKVYNKHYMYIPEGEIQNKFDDNINIGIWIEQGYIIPTPGSSVDYDFISKKILDLNEQYNVLAVAYDRYQNKFVTKYLTDINTIDFDQSLKGMSQPTKDWEKLIYDSKNNKLKGLIDSNPVMRWMLSCSVIKPDVNGNYKPLKSSINKKHKRIDAVITSIMGYSILTTLLDGDTTTKKYTYEELIKLL